MKGYLLTLTTKQWKQTITKDIEYIQFSWLFKWQVFGMATAANIQFCCKQYLYGTHIHSHLYFSKFLENQ